MNPDKTEFMVFGNHGVQEQLIINDQVIKEVKYLGVILDKKLKYVSHVNQIFSKIGSRN